MNITALREMNGNSVLNTLIFRKKIDFRLAPISCLSVWVLIFIFIPASPAFAQDSLSPADVLSHVNAVWSTGISALLLLMNAGFWLFIAGWSRRQNIVAILWQGVLIMSMATLVYWAVGFFLMFGENNAFIGLVRRIQGEDFSRYLVQQNTADIKINSLFLLYVFESAIPSAIVASSVIEKAKAQALISFCGLFSVFCLPVVGHWVWGSGWLASRGFIDFAGASVIYSVGGWAALAGVLTVGWPVRAAENSRANEPAVHNVPLATVGFVLFALGVVSFNLGANLSFDYHVTHIALNVLMAAVLGGTITAVISWLSGGKPLFTLCVPGAIAGLVAISAGSHSVPMTWAAEIGLIAGVLVCLSDDVIRRFHLDRAMISIATFLISGVWGTLSVGLFDRELGVFYGGGFGQLSVQALGVVSIGLFTVITSMILWFLLKNTIGVSRPLSRNEDVLQPMFATEGYSGFMTSQYFIFRKILNLIRLRNALGWILIILPVIALKANAQSSAGTSSTSVSAGDIQVILDNLWILVSTLLVFILNVGLGLLAAGLCRQKNAVSLLYKTLVVAGISILVFWAVGYGLAFGEGNPVFGSNGFFLSGSQSIEFLTLTLPVFFLYQAVFAGTTAIIVLGAVAERVRFVSFVLFSILFVAFSYPITTHWVWGGGWLSNISFLGEGTYFSDFAGSAVVHAVGGWAALVGSVVIGPRIGKYQNGRVNVIAGHNMGLATLGCLLVWVGWTGFTAGSELAASLNVPQIALITNLAAAAAGLSASATAWYLLGRADLKIALLGIVAGLVSISGGCGGMGYVGAVLTGLVGGILAVVSLGFFESIKIDDPVGVLSVHLVCGIWGALAVGFFDQTTGLFFGSGIVQLIAQLIGVVSISVFTITVASIFWIAIKTLLGIRVSSADELNGLDLSEHGMEAYAGFLKEPDDSLL